MEYLLNSSFFCSKYNTERTESARKLPGGARTKEYFLSKLAVENPFILLGICLIMEHEIEKNDGMQRRLNHE